MTTESKARELWCPMVRHEGDDGGSFNRGFLDHNPLNKRKFDNTPSNGCFCIASECAMWRWDVMDAWQRFVRANVIDAQDIVAAKGPLFGQNVDGYEFVPWDDENDPQESPAGWLETKESMLARRAGYCGLAGKPVF